MFKLKRIEMLGFKSFGDRTRLEFADGIVAVVGPNGCGKSNLSDSISWVLGEQSARVLRGERMADVIFNGTGTRPPTGMAEVSLTLVDPEYLDAENAVAKPEEEVVEASDAGASTADAANHGSNGDGPASKPKALHHRAGEITVTRRLFRSGESEYLLNGDICRLRDIQDLFMGTGLGPESYAIIEQGRIGQILSSKPSDRRAIIEEAAGVSKFKTRKRLAEAKLESSRLNLARITDILEEVTKQVASLKRQASKARRFKELREELRGRQKVVLTSRLLALETECRRLRDELAAIQAECAGAAERLDALERAQKEAATRYEELEARLTGLREALSQGELERERVQSRIEQVRQQISTLDTRTEEAALESAQLQTQLDALERETRERALQAEQLRQDWMAAQEAAARMLERQERLAAEAQRAETELEACRQALLETVSRGADLRNQLVQAEEIGLALDRQASRTDTERGGVEQEYQRLLQEFKTYESDHARDASTVANLTQSLSETAAALEEARREEGARRGQLEKLREAFSGAVARRQALEESLAQHAYSTEAVRKLVSGGIPSNGHHFQPLGVLADFVEVTSGYEEVVEEFLRYDLDCVVVERHEEARTGIELLRREGSGRSTFFVTQVPSNRHLNGHADAEIRATRGVVAAMRDLVRFQPRLGLNGDLALPDLATAYVVEDGETAERLAVRYPECHFLTTGGDHYHHRLVSGGRGQSTGPLAARRDFRELERRTQELESSVQSAEKALAEITGHALGLEQDLRNLTAAKLESEKNAVVAEEKLRQVREAFDRTSERLRVLTDEARALQAERQTNDARQKELRAQLEAAASEQVRREEEIAAAANALRELRSQLEKLAQELVEGQALASALEERARAAEAERSRLVLQGEEVLARLTRLADQSDGWRMEQQQLAEEEKNLLERARGLEVEQEAARQELRTLEEESRAIRARRDELGPQIDAARVELETWREKRSEIEVALARADSDHSHHAEQCREELSAEPAQLLAELPAETLLAGDLLHAAEEEVRQIKTRIENLGAINMEALEQLQEAEERFTFLETQRQDLLASIEDTAQAIREIDEVSRQQFLEAFKAINGYFAESFRTLFGGGVGEMRLSDESDADSGIDIAAQPPGKRLQNVLLLSGGEKALAALALLIAVFRYTPSPFCVLDEVDAPLDESNVDRFTRMIRQMSRHTQFILITHNKRTMEIAQVLYGVTMEEPGISKLVSVRFDEVEPEPVAVPA